MRRGLMGLTAAALLLLAGAAGAVGAVGKGGTLYIRAKDCRIFEEPNLTSKVNGMVQPGQGVTWLGAAEGNRQLHLISVTTKSGKSFKGYTLQQNLTPNKPSDEFLAKDDGKAISPQAFASSGAATKALSEAALKYSEFQKKQSMTDLTKGVMSAEAVARQITKDTAVAFTLSRTGGGK